MILQLHAFMDRLQLWRTYISSRNQQKYHYLIDVDRKNTNNKVIEGDMKFHIGLNFLPLDLNNLLKLNSSKHGILKRYEMVCQYEFKSGSCKLPLGKTQRLKNTNLKSCILVIV